jgi:VanZ family protein
MGKQVMQNKYVNYAAPIVWMVFIFFLSSRSNFPGHFSQSQYQYISSLAHIFLYIVLTFLIANALMTGKVKFKHALFNALIIAMIYGALDEWHQAFVLGREARLSDWLLDLVGCLVAGNLFWLKVNIRINKEGKLLGK